VAPDTLTKPAIATWPWWTIPEGERLHMHAFTRPSQQLRHKVRQALIRSLHYASLYRRLLVANKNNGARLQIVGWAIYRKLNSMLRKAPPSLNLYMANFTMANSHRDMATRLRMSAHYATSRTHAHTSRVSALTTKLSASVGTMPRVSSFTRPPAKPRKGEAHSTPPRAYS
jgi:hypothetical protein